MKNFLAGAVTAFIMSSAVMAFAQRLLSPGADAYPINYINAIANAITPSGKVRGIKSDEEGRVICAR
jgi:hypothetical protein